MVQAGAQANRNHIRSLVVAIAPVMSRHPVACAYLFGSHARGEQSADSDVDLYCRIDRSKPFGIFALGLLVHDLEEALCSDVDVVTADDLERTNPRLFHEIERDKVLVYERA